MNFTVFSNEGLVLMFLTQNKGCFVKYIINTLRQTLDTLFFCLTNNICTSCYFNIEQRTRLKANRKTETRGGQNQDNQFVP